MVFILKIPVHTITIIFLIAINHHQMSFIVIIIMLTSAATTELLQGRVNIVGGGDGGGKHSGKHQTYLGSYGRQEVIYFGPLFEVVGVKGSKAQYSPNISL